ncbi:MAG: Acyl-[acyl-carrier-protein]--UDP-N-acetylglucosamine O-acyltransferase [Bacteroidetes bacterium]|nr:Acyl-[acyl-carrier-protein]--UDP-N-acetylglucosamine O-acyltransferase [Bacteroidota bacterium]
MSIDSAARVSTKANLGSNVSIGPFTIVEDGAVIGDGTSIAANALIGKGARIGKNCKIHHGAVVGHEPQDLKYAGEPTICEIGDRTIIREYATVHRGTVDGGRTAVGSDCLVMAYVHIAHDCLIGNKVIIASGAMMAGHCEMEDHVTIGGLAAIHQFVRVGCHAMLRGGSRVGKDIPPYVLAGLEPLVFGGLNSVGLRRRGFSPETMAILDRVYNIIYNSKLNVTQALERIRQDDSLATVPEVQHIVAFIASSKRGIIPALRSRR